MMKLIKTLNTAPLLLWKSLLRVLKPVHTTPEKFENGVFSQKKLQTFSVHSKAVKFENAATQTDLRDHCYCDDIVFEKLR